MRNLIKSLAPLVSSTILPSPQRKTHVKKLLETEWNLPLPVRDSILLRHFILYWSPQYLRQQLQDSESVGYPNIIYKEGRNYRVVFHHGAIRDTLSIDGCAQVALSFRVPKHEFEIDPIVLVSIASSVLHRQKQLHAGHSAKSGKPCNRSHLKETKQGNQ